MKRISPLLRRSGAVDMDSAMTPMIDVVFLLLVFFVWTASFQIAEQVLPSTLSEQTGSDPINNVDPPEPKDFEDVVVRIGWDGVSPIWRINSDIFPSLAEVQQRLTSISKIGTDSPVILNPEPAVPLGFVIEAYDVAKHSGFKEVAFAIKAQGR